MILGLVVPSSTAGISILDWMCNEWEGPWFDSRPPNQFGLVVVDASCSRGVNGSRLCISNNTNNNTNNNNGHSVFFQTSTMRRFFLSSVFFQSLLIKTKTFFVIHSLEAFTNYNCSLLKSQFTTQEFFSRMKRNFENKRIFFQYREEEERKRFSKEHLLLKRVLFEQQKKQGNAFFSANDGVLKRWSRSGAAKFFRPTLFRT